MKRINKKSELVELVKELEVRREELGDDDLCPDCNAPMHAHDDGECPKFFEDCHEDLDPRLDC